MSTFALPHLWIPRQLPPRICLRCGKVRHRRRSLFRRILDPLALFASGDVLLDGSGKIILDASGNMMLDDGSGSGCCCGKCHCTTGTGAYYGSTFLVTVTGCDASIPLGTCIQDPGTGEFGTYTTAPVDGTYCISFVSDSTLPTSQLCSYTFHDNVASFTSGVDCAHLINSGTTMTWNITTAWTSGSFVGLGFGASGSHNGLAQNPPGVFNTGTIAVACGGSGSGSNIQTYKIGASTFSFTGSVTVTDVSC